MSLTALDLLTYFTLQGSRIVTNAGATLRLTGAGHFEAEAEAPLQNPLSMRIVTEADSAFSFIDGFGITDLSEIGQIGYDNLRIRYLHGEAVLYVRLPNLGVEIGFQLVQSRTIVFQQEHHFYDAVEGHLSLSEQLGQYIQEARDLLWCRFLSPGGGFGVNLELLN
jgi:hypothetical protein